jgi:hypothetical protein
MNSLKIFCLSSGLSPGHVYLGNSPYSFQEIQAIPPGATKIFLTVKWLTEFPPCKVAYRISPLFFRSFSGSTKVSPTNTGTRSIDRSTSRGTRTPTPGQPRREQSLCQMPTGSDSSAAGAAGAPSGGASGARGSSGGSRKSEVNSKRGDWSNNYAAKYGLAPVFSTEKQGVVASATCQFCLSFGRELYDRDEACASTASAPSTVAAVASTVSPAAQATPATPAHLSNGTHAGSTSTFKPRQTPGKSRTIKSFNVFRTDMFMAHLKTCRQTRWDAYQSMSAARKASYF